MVVQRLRIGVLGRLEVDRRGRPVDPGTLKQRSLLGLLALRPNEIVQQAEIVDALWGEHPPDTCLNLVHTYTSRLRKLIGPDRVISTCRGGYALTVDSEQLDLLRFNELAGRAWAARQRDPHLAVRLFEEALRAWRGPLLTDLPPSVRRHPVGAAAAARRLAIALEFADLVLALDLPGTAAVEQLRTLAREEPLHEGLHARLMLALAGSGQRAAALRVFTEITRRLDDELGVAPGAEIRAAHLRMVRRATAVPAQLPADVAGFAGRAADLVRLDGLLRGTGMAIGVITGSAGVGKTALAVRWAHRVRDRFPDGQLYVDLRGYAGTAPVTPLAALTGFLRALGVQPDRVPVDEEEAANLYRTRLADREALIVLDNAADVTQVRPLLPGSPGCEVLVTSRDRLTGLVAMQDARPLVLDVLEPRDAVALLAGMLGERRVLAEPDAAAELGRVCAHLPLALRIAGADLVAAPRRSITAHVAELRGQGQPKGAVRAAFEASYTRLEPATRRMFRLLGLVPGPDFTPEAAAALADCPVDRARRMLGQLAAAHLVTQPAPGRYRFHDLLRDFAAGLAARRDDGAAATGRLLDFYLCAAGRATRLLYPHVLRLPEPAWREESGPAGESAAIDWLEAEHANLLAAVSAPPGSSHAWRIADALRGYFVSRGHGADGLAAGGAALRAAERAGDEQGRASALDVLGLIHYNLGDFRAALDCHTRALMITRRTGDLAAEANALHNLGRACAHLGQPVRATGFHERALEINRRLGDRHGEALTLNYLGSAALVLGRPEAAHAYSGAASRLAREIGDRHVEVRALNSLGLIHWAAGRSYLVAEDYFLRALGLARDIGFCYGEASVLVGLSRVRRCTGRPAEAIADCHEALRLMRDRGIRLFEGRALAELAHAHLELGEVARAADYAGQTLEVVRHRSQRLIEARALHILGLARRATGDLDSARSHWDEALTIFADIGAPEERAVRTLLTV